MSRLGVSAAVVVGGAFVILATSCTNDFDRLFLGEDAAASDGGKKPVDTGSNEEICTGKCAADQSTTDVGRKFVCPACPACTCLVECSDKDKTCGGTCQDGAFCDVTCGVAGCSLACDSKDGCILRCGATKGACDLDCKGGSLLECADGSRACNTPCPK